MRRPLLGAKIVLADVVDCLAILLLADFLMEELYVRVMDGCDDIDELQPVLD